MQFVKYLCGLLILCASCRGVHQSAALPANVNHLPIAYAVSSQMVPHETTTPEPVTTMPESSVIEESNLPEKAISDAIPVQAKSSGKKVQSFTQLKKMAATGELKMSKKDLKVLNRLEKKYKGNFEKFRADTFEFTTKAKIIAGVGLIGLLLTIFTGSWFGAFLFILAALGFILRFVGVIEF